MNERTRMFFVFHLVVEDWGWNDIEIKFEAGVVKKQNFLKFF